MHAADPARLAGEEQIEGRSLSRIVWSRLRRDTVALAGGAFIVLLVTVAIRPLRLSVLVFLIGFVSWPYTLRTELLPNLMAPILVHGHPRAARRVSGSARVARKGR